jgi:hypothetical protein
MSRGLADAALATALSAAHVTQFLMIELQLDSGTLRIATTPFPVDYGGFTWFSSQNLGSIEPVMETASEQRGLTFTLGGVPPSIVSSVLNENVQGRAVKLLLAVLDGGTLRVDTNAWSGLLDVLTLEDGTPTATVRVTAEHRLIAWREPQLVRHSDEDHKRLHPGDKFYEYAAEIAEATIVWPGKEFFRQ